MRLVDGKKVLRGLETCQSGIASKCTECVYRGDSCTQKLTSDAYTLLHELKESYSRLIDEYDKMIVERDFYKKALEMKRGEYDGTD